MAHDQRYVQLQASENVTSVTDQAASEKVKHQDIIRKCGVIFELAKTRKLILSAINGTYLFFIKYIYLYL